MKNATEIVGNMVRLEPPNPENDREAETNEKQNEELNSLPMRERRRFKPLI
jgi:hypothetical protein